MPCALTQAYVLDCREAVGGIKSVYFINRKDVTTITEAAGIVTAITKGAGKVFYKYELVRGTSSFTDTLTGSTENGSVFFNQELKIVLNRMQANTRNEILLLAKNNLIAIIEDNSGKYWLAGKLNGLDLNNGPATTGVAMGDRNGYELTFQGGEKEYAPEVQSTIIAGLIA